MNLLAKILESKRTEIAQKQQLISTDYLKSQAAARAAQPDFREALTSAPIGLIAEIKRKSPSAGDIRAEMDPKNIAEDYAHAGAQALSILVDEAFFGARESDFGSVRKTVELPLLYKEFVVDGWQIWHAASQGASAVLLIAAALNDQELDELLECADRAHLTPLVEVHTAEEMKRIKALNPSCVGINNRDLTTFEVSLETTFRLLESLPEGATVVSESGIRKPEDILKLKAAGVHAVLVGEQLLRQDDVGQAVKELMGGVWESS